MRYQVLGTVFILQKITPREIRERERTSLMDARQSLAYARDFGHDMLKKIWYARRDSNPQPSESKSDALSS